MASFSLVLTIDKVRTEDNSGLVVKLSDFDMVGLMRFSFNNTGWNTRIVSIWLFF